MEKPYSVVEHNRTFLPSIKARENPSGQKGPKLSLFWAACSEARGRRDAQPSHSGCGRRAALFRGHPFGPGAQSLPWGVAGRPTAEPLRRCPPAGRGNRGAALRGGRCGAGAAGPPPPRHPAATQTRARGRPGAPAAPLPPLHAALLCAGRRPGRRLLRRPGTPRRGVSAGGRAGGLHPPGCGGLQRAARGRPGPAC